MFHECAQTATSATNAVSQLHTNDTPLHTFGASLRSTKKATEKRRTKGGVAAAVATVNGDDDGDGEEARAHNVLASWLRLCNENAVTEKEQEAKQDTKEATDDALLTLSNSVTTLTDVKRQVAPLLRQFVNVRNAKGQSPLTMALQNADSMSQLIARCLLLGVDDEAGNNKKKITADPTIGTCRVRGADGNTALHLCAYNAALCRRDINDRNGRPPPLSPLPPPTHQCIIDAFAAKGMLDVKNSKGETALQVALENGRSNAAMAVRLIRAGASVVFGKAVVVGGEGLRREKGVACCEPPSFASSPLSATPSPSSPPPPLVKPCSVCGGTTTALHLIAARVRVMEADAAGEKPPLISDLLQPVLDALAAGGISVDARACTCDSQQHASSSSSSITTQSPTPANKNMGEKRKVERDAAPIDGRAPRVPRREGEEAARTMKEEANHCAVERKGRARKGRGPTALQIALERCTRGVSTCHATLAIVRFLLDQGKADPTLIWYRDDDDDDCGLGDECCGDTHSPPPYTATILHCIAERKFPKHRGFRDLFEHALLPAFKTRRGNAHAEGSIDGVDGQGRSALTIALETVQLHLVTLLVRSGGANAVVGTVRTSPDHLALLCNGRRRYGSRNNARGRGGVESTHVRKTRGGRIYPPLVNCHQQHQCYDDQTKSRAHNDSSVSKHQHSHRDYNKGHYYKGTALHWCAALPARLLGRLVQEYVLVLMVRDAMMRQRRGSVSVDTSQTPLPLSTAPDESAAPFTGDTGSEGIKTQSGSVIADPVDSNNETVLCALLRRQKITRKGAPTLCSSPPSVVAFVRMLIEAGGPQICCARNPVDGSTILHHCAQNSSLAELMLSLLGENSGDEGDNWLGLRLLHENGLLNAQNRKGETPLAIALASSSVPHWSSWGTKVWYHSTPLAPLWDYAGMLLRLCCSADDVEEESDGPIATQRTKATSTAHSGARVWIDPTIGHYCCGSDDEMSDSILHLVCGHSRHRNPIVGTSVGVIHVNSGQTRMAGEKPPSLSMVPENNAIIENANRMRKHLHLVSWTTVKRADSTEPTKRSLPSAMVEHSSNRSIEMIDDTIISHPPPMLFGAFYKPIIDAFAAKGMLDIINTTVVCSNAGRVGNSLWSEVTRETALDTALRVHNVPMVRLLLAAGATLTDISSHTCDYVSYTLPQSSTVNKGGNNGGGAGFFARNSVRQAQSTLLTPPPHSLLPNASPSLSRVADSTLVCCVLAGMLLDHGYDSLDVARWLCRACPAVRHLLFGKSRKFYAPGDDDMELNGWWQSILKRSHSSTSSSAAAASRPSSPPPLSDAISDEIMDLFRDLLRHREVLKAEIAN